jgi:hypothetical protein
MHNEPHTVRANIHAGMGGDLAAASDGAESLDVAASRSESLDVTGERFGSKKP